MPILFPVSLSLTLMTFPHYLWLGSLKLHPHLVFELLAYSIGFQLYRLRLKRQPSGIAGGDRLWLLVAVVLGAALGARLLAWIETPWDPVTGQWIVPGKTIVGGLLGGWAAIESTKARLGITSRTGDLYVLPLIVGIVLGRIGCFLTGLDDHTHGLPVGWGVDFGDGVLRHPTQLYEAGFLLALPLVGLSLRPWLPALAPGVVFQAFMAAYLGFRFGVEWIKPTLKIYAGLSAIQWASLIGLSVALYHIRQLLKPLAAPQTNEGMING